MYFRRSGPSWRRLTGLLPSGLAWPRILSVLAGLFLTGCLSNQPSLYQTPTYDQIKAELEKPAFGQAAPGPRVERPPSPLGLDEAVKTAWANNPEVEAALARIGRSEALIDRAQAVFWPRLSLRAGFTGGDAPSAFLFQTIDQRLLEPGVDFNRPGSFQSFEVGLKARWNLFNGGRDLLGLRMAETGLTVSRLDRRTVDNGLAASVIQAYFNLLATRDFRAIAQETERSVAEQLRVMEVRFQAGGALRSDVLSLKVRLAQAREEEVRALNSLKLSQAALANLLGFDPNTELKPPKDGRSGLAQMNLDLPRDQALGQALGLSLRPELAKVRQELIRSRMNLDLARAGYLPTVDLEARYYLADPNLEFDLDRDNYLVGINLNWEFFSGFSTPAKVRAAQETIREVAARDRKTALSVQLDVKTAYLNLDGAEARLEVTEASVAQAQESLKLVKRQYEGGSATVTRYLDAELALNRARTLATAAFYDQQKALADLGRATGWWAGREGRDGRD